MGNSSTKEEEEVVVTQEAVAAPSSPVIVTADDSYKWPENLYVETRDMAAAAFLVYAFGLTLDVARDDGLKGMDVNKETGQVSNPTTFRLGRSFTPEEVKQIIVDNRDVLAARYPDEFEQGADFELLQKTLQLLQDRSVASGMNRPLTLVEFDDRHQEKEMVYAVAKDDANKRITLVFRGTDNDLAMYDNWLTNISIPKVEADVPDAVQDKAIWFHGGFYDYIFKETVATEDAPDKRKYDEILEDIKPLLEANPGYKLYVSGHSLGGALSTIVAFYLACDDSIPKPVTCISFAAPRVGDSGFRETVNALEQAKRLRMLRVVNDNDTIAMVPTVNFKHAGFQLRLYNNPSSEPEVTYPKSESDFWAMAGRAWGNSVFTSLNFGYDHGEYRERVDENQAFLETKDLNALYNDVDLVGFSWA